MSILHNISAASTPSFPSKFSKISVCQWFPKKLDDSQYSFISRVPHNHRQ
jgi:hypothetical protein